MNTFLKIFFIFLALFLFSSTADAQFTITSPIKELGNCTSEESCRQYCNKYKENYLRCIDYLVRNQYIEPEEGIQYKELATLIPSAPVGTQTTTTSANTPIVSVPNKDALSGIVPVYVKTDNVEKVTLYIFGQGVLIPTFIGSASNTTIGEWLFSWDTREYADGNYMLRARVQRGTAQAETDLSVTVKNVGTTITPASGIQDTSNAITKATNDSEALVTEATQLIETTINRYIEGSSVGGGTQEDDINDFEELLRIQKERLFSAVGTTTVISDPEITSKIDELSARVANKENGEKLEEELRTTLSQFDVSLAKVKETFDGRVGPSITKDSDKDGVSDYDETRIYKTDPLRADTDGDKIGDGEEILSGTSPLATSTVPIVYEEPTIAGTLVRDTFFVDEMKVLETREVGGKLTASKIEFRGRALPRSFVTLYIYSSPTVATVKADGNGKWVYTLDKELEDGSHQIYVAVVDTTGKILAKGDAVPFVKQAAAVELGSTSLGITTGPSFLTSRVLGFALLGIAVLSVLVLIVVGAIHRGHKHDDLPPIGTPPPNA